MLGGKKDSNQRSGNIIPAATTHALNSLVQGTAMTGDIKADSDIRIDGALKGTLQCKSKVIIGPTGSVEGEVKCANAVIEGRFEGILFVSELLHVKETARISGKINTEKIIVQSGAVFNVTCQMGNAPAGNGNSRTTQEQKEFVKSAATVPA